MPELLIKKEEDIIDQKDKIAEDTKSKIQEFGWVWSKVTGKLSNDGICYSCKKKLDVENDEKFKVSSVNNKSVDRGLVCFVSLCEKCSNKLEKQREPVKEEKS